MKPVNAEVLSSVGGHFKAFLDEPSELDSGDKVVIVPVETWDAMIRTLRLAFCYLPKGVQQDEVEKALRAAGVKS